MTKLAQALATMEGFFTPGSRAARNNNPGNLRTGLRLKLKGQIGIDSHDFAVFNTPLDGWAALDHQIDIDAARNHTLASFLAKYAPPSENNTSNYLKYVSSKLKVPPDTPLIQVKELLYHDP